MKGERWTSSAQLQAQTTSADANIIEMIHPRSTIVRNRVNSVDTSRGRELASADANMKETVHPRPRKVQLEDETVNAASGNTSGFLDVLLRSCLVLRGEVSCCVLAQPLCDLRQLFS